MVPLVVGDSAVFLCTLPSRSCFTARDEAFPAEALDEARRSCTSVVPVRQQVFAASSLSARGQPNAAQRALSPAGAGTGGRPGDANADRTFDCAQRVRGHRCSRPSRPANRQSRGPRSTGNPPGLVATCRSRARVLLRISVRRNDGSATTRLADGLHARDSRRNQRSSGRLGMGRTVGTSRDCVARVGLSLCIAITASRSAIAPEPHAHSPLNAIDNGIRAARIAGNSPPTSPMNSAYTIAPTIRGGVTSKAKETWLKVCQFIVALR
jgi:hypothetical protein